MHVSGEEAQVCLFSGPIDRQLNGGGVGGGIFLDCLKSNRQTRGVHNSIFRKGGRALYTGCGTQMKLTREP